MAQSPIPNVCLQIALGFAIVGVGTIEALAQTKVAADSQLPGVIKGGDQGRLNLRADEQDIVCQQLMQDYILRGGKMETAPIDAAIVLIASRSRGGYWREVVKQFEESPIEGRSHPFTPSTNLLKILTRILQRDGSARWLSRHPDELGQMASPPSVTLPPQVLETIIDRAKRVNLAHFNRYVVAVVAAHDARSTEFLLDVLKGDFPRVDGQQVVGSDSQFHAAVGLANLGHTVGLEWLLHS